MKRYFLISYLIITLSLILINITYGVNVYVGVKINNLSDDPAYSCAGESGYGPNGRIRALASIYPTYPIYFNLSRVSDGSTVWAGNDTADTDYMIDDTIYLPNTVDLTIGDYYNFFFDVDAYMIYLPLITDGTFVANTEDHYYTIGSTTSTSRYRSTSGACAFNSVSSWTEAGQPAIYSNRSLSVSRGIRNTLSFNIGNSYNGLSDASNGNFNIVFQMS